MTSDGDTNDLVLFPIDFASLQLPELLISFFDKFEIHYKSENSFPMGILRSLYRMNYKLFYNVVYFLSLYGCDFHSAKNNSFFPSDVNDEEDVLIFSGSSDASFSIPEMNKYGVWDFFTNASSSKCTLLNGVVVSRLKKTSRNAFAKLNDCPLISVSSKRLYGTDLPNEKLDDVIKEHVSETLEDTSATSEPSDKSDTSEFSSDRDVQNNACDNEKNRDLKMAFSNEFFFNPDESKTIDNDNPLNSVPISSATGVCAPRFWIRFISSFFSMNPRAKDVYSNAGYKMFADLVNFKKEDIKKIVDGVSNCIDDPYLAGIYENELICFCKNRDSFLAKFGESHLLKEFLVPSDFTLSCVQSHPNLFYYFDLGISPFLSSPLQVLSQRLPQANNFAATYLEMFHVIDLSFLDNKLLLHSINDYGLQAEDEYLSYFLRPFNVVDGLLCSLMGRSPFDAFGLDHEIYSLRIPDFLRCFYSNIGKYADEKHKKHLEILSLRETTNITLEELG